MIIEVLAVIGFLLSVYSLYIEKNTVKSDEYKAACDINDKISCTKAFSSEFGKTFGISNSVYGMFFYVLIFVLAQLDLVKYVFYLEILGVLGSIYLIWALIKIRNLCVVCVSIHIVNLLLLIFSWRAVF